VETYHTPIHQTQYSINIYHNANLQLNNKSTGHVFYEVHKDISSDQSYKSLDSKL